jgi:hypothetical protein
MGLQGRMEKVKKYTPMRGLGGLPQKSVELPRLDSCNFNMVFAHFQTKKDFSWERQRG